MLGEEFVRELVPLVFGPSAELDVVKGQLERLQFDRRVGNGTNATQQVVEVILRKTSLERDFQCITSDLFLGNVAHVTWVQCVNVRVASRNVRLQSLQNVMISRPLRPSQHLLRPPLRTTLLYNGHCLHNCYHYSSGSSAMNVKTRITNATQS